MATSSSISNAPNGLSSFGIPLIGNSIPSSPGNYIFVDYGNGKDGAPLAANSPQYPYKTIEYAYTKMRTNKDDVMVLQGDSTHVLAAMLDISKNRVHFVGMDGTPGRMYGNNAKVSLAVSTGATNVFTMKNTGIRNSFHNIKFINGATVAEGLYCVGEGGEYALYTNCEIYKSTDLDETTSAELVLNGDSAQFYGCTIGSLADTRVGVVRRPNVLLTKEVVAAGKVTRDCQFIDCNFWIQASHTTSSFVYSAGATDVERMLMFKRCAFINSLASSATPAQAIAGAATLTVGNIMLDPACFATKVTKVSTTTGVLVSGSAPNDGTGISVNAA
jgi:hypothetical protein